MIQLKNIFKSFTYQDDILKNISLEIKANEFVSLMGPSGSGKSTLLNILGGIDTCSKGKVIIKKKDISNFDDKKLSIYRNKTVGFIFQEFHLDESLTVKENILLPTYFKKDRSKKDEIYAEKLIKEVGLEKKSNEKIKSLSGGQKQRTAIARALINKPKLIIADEPTGNLDSITSKKIISLLKNLHKKHKTTLIIATHDVNIAKISKRTIKIKDGKLC